MSETDVKGRMEDWKNGMLEEWKNGVLEYWNIGKMEIATPNCPLATADFSLRFALRSLQNRI